MTLKVFLGGEGPNDIGQWGDLPQYRDDPPRPGVLNVLLEKVQPDGWQVVDGRRWKRIRKYRAGKHDNEETQNILGLINTAIDRKCDVLVFCRDRDGDKFQHRVDDIKAGIEQAADILGDRCPMIVGEVAIERLESWLVALSGKTKSETLRKKAVEKTLDQLGINPKSTRDMVAFAEKVDLDRVPDDAESLQRWVTKAKRVLGQQKN